ncbi:low temperature requirement protein A [Devosia rhodophyticola]|uniref:Low temperature requirement protein A n=1 Tax=Devosia rhodophyticola TaxID=3026423 RepID=A0ABY7YVR9_9HYPH|nr:low temperature requirement protein A [Devosia rhodophyticola]WDR05203.1 low temperature requirement protein A [Devosia rhodophyticola]
MSYLLKVLAPTSALRRREGGHARVTNMELFFDLVYVFSIIQLSHFLLEHQTWVGALQAATVFAGVWWAWNYTAWATNWIDPDHAAGRVLMIVLMGCALLMAIAIPYSFDDRGGLFVGAYVVMALVRAGYMAALFRGQTMGRNYAQLCAWSAFSGLFWIAGVVLPDLRLPLWIAAVLIDYAAPFAGFWLPGVGATPMNSWPLAGLHLLERNQQVFIISLGESILLLGGTLVGATLLGASLLAAGIGFGIIVTLWWLYFVHTTSRGEHAFEHASDHTRLARSGLAYAHGIMVAGAIVVAVAIEEIIAHPTESAHLPTIFVAVLGPAIYLLGSAIFYRTMAQRIPLAYFAGFALLAALGWGIQAFHASALSLGVGVLAVMITLAFAAAREQRA